MKKQKMLITLSGLVAAVAATATITVSILAADGGGDSAKESVGTTEPAFDTGGPSSFDLGPGQNDGKGGVFVTNPDPADGETDGPVPDPVDGETDGPATGGPATGIPKPPDTEPLLEDSPRTEPLGDDEAGEVVGQPTTYETWLKDNPPTDDMTDTGTETDGPPLHGDPTYEQVMDHLDDIDEWAKETWLKENPPTDDMTDTGTDTDVPVIEPLTPLSTDDVEDLDDQVVRVTGGLAELQDNLLATGAEVKLTGAVVEQDIFSVDGRVVQVNGESVQVMDYGDAAALEAEAAGISPDGSSVGTTMVMWVGSPHFFRTDSLIVLYVGESPTVTEVLAKVMGPQFAGR